jgi:hypothetical protein
VIAPATERRPGDAIAAFTEERLDAMARAVIHRLQRWPHFDPDGHAPGVRTLWDCYCVYRRTGEARALSGRTVEETIALFCTDRVDALSDAEAELLSIALIEADWPDTQRDDAAITKALMDRLAEHAAERPWKRFAAMDAC